MTANDKIQLILSSYVEQIESPDITSGEAIDAMSIHKIMNDIRSLNLKSTYQVVLDDQKLKEFIDWLPELESHEMYYVSLFARSKYCKDITHIKSDKQQLKRFTSNKKNLFNKLKQLEIAAGQYINHQGVTIPQEALAVYINVNPRSMFKASVSALKKFVELVTLKQQGYNPHQEVLSEIQKSKSYTAYIDFDIDNETSTPQQLLERLCQYVNIESVSLLRTRGGYHILIDPKKVSSEFTKSFYQNIHRHMNADIVGDNMIPVPGCYQGGFMPNLITTEQCRQLMV